MKLLKPWGAARGGLLHLTLLLSLTGFRVDLDLYLLLPPPAPLLDELLWPGGPTGPAHPRSPFPASGEWGRTGPQHPKGLASDAEALLQSQLLREVRALGVPFIPRTRVDAWLVHGVAAGDTDGAHGLFGAASSAGGVGASVDSSSQAAPGGGGDSREALSSPVAATEEEEEEAQAAAEPTAQVPDAGGRAGQDTEVVLKQHTEAVDHNSQREERVSAQKRKSLQQSNKDDSKITAKPDWETEKTTESRNERHLNWTDTSFSLEDFFQLLSSQANYSLEEISLEDISPLPGNVSDGMNSSGYDCNVNFSQAISHDVNLHEAMLLSSNNTFIRNPVARTSQAPEPFLQLNSHTNCEQTLSGSNLTGFFPLADNQLRNLTSQDLLYDLDENVLGEINLMSLATDFDPLDASQLCEEPDSDSGLSLNSSHNNTCITKSNSSHSTYEGATGYSSDPEFQDLEGAVGGCYPEPSKLCHVNHRNEHILHNHTYHLQPSAPQPTSESFRYLDDKGRNLSRDERRAKALHIPFSVDEIVGMPVDSFNSMLSRHYLTDLQVSLIRDIRRRGKNKVAAQNCRKRKLDIILNLEDDVNNLQAKKETLKREKTQCNKAIGIMKQKLHDLYHDVFSRLRDDQGRPVNPNQYTLQCSHDGAVLIVPKELVMPSHKKETQKGKSERH